MQAFTSRIPEAIRVRKAYIFLAAIVIAAFLLPFALIRAPLGSLYLDKSIPVQSAGVWYASCPSCFDRDPLDVFTVGTRTLSERHILWPFMARAAALTRTTPTVASWWAGVLIAVLGVWAVYWTLFRLTGNCWFAGAISLIFLPGVQIFGGPWFGGMLGGYQSHALAIALGAWLFGAFVVTVSRPNGGEASLKYFYACALAMNLYPLVFPHLMIMMALYLLWCTSVPWRKLLWTLLFSIPLAPVAIADFVLLYLRPAHDGLKDFRAIMPYAYVENWSFFMATGRRFLAPAVVLGGMAWLRRRFPASSVEDHPARRALVALAWLSFVLTIASIFAEQLSLTVLRLEFASSMCEWLFLSLLFLAAHDLAAYRWPTRWRLPVLTLFVLYLFTLSSNVFYTVNTIREWMGYGALLRDRAAMLDAIRTLPPHDAVFLAPPTRIADAIRGSAGRGVVVGFLEGGAAQIDASKYQQWQDLFASVTPIDFGDDLQALKDFARAHGADYVIVVNPAAALVQEGVVYRNSSFAVILP